MDVVAFPDLEEVVDLPKMDEEAMAHQDEEEEAMVRRPADTEVQDQEVAEARRLKDIKAGRTEGHRQVLPMDLALVWAPMVPVNHRRTLIGNSPPALNLLRRDMETLNSQDLSIRHTTRDMSRSREPSLLLHSPASMTACPALP